MPDPDTTQTDTEQSDLAHADVAIVCAPRIELKPFLDRCDRLRKYTGGKFVFRGGRYDSTHPQAMGRKQAIGFANGHNLTGSKLRAGVVDGLIYSTIPATGGKGGAA